MHVHECVCVCICTCLRAHTDTQASTHQKHERYDHTSHFQDHMKPVAGEPAQPPHCVSVVQHTDVHLQDTRRHRKVEQNKREVLAGS